MLDPNLTVSNDWSEFSTRLLTDTFSTHLLVSHQLNIQKLVKSNALPHELGPPRGV